MEVKNPRKLNKKDIEEVLRLRSLFPREISVYVQRSVDGGFVAEVLDFPGKGDRGCVTQGETFSELIEMVNDAIYSFFEIPSRFISYMPNYIPPIEVAVRFNLFPVKKTNEKVRLTLPSELEKANC